MNRNDKDIVPQLEDDYGMYAMVGGCNTSEIKESHKNCVGER